MSSRRIGTVKWFNTEKGYRAIDPDSAGFKNLSEGQEVEFIQVQSEKGWQAVEVELLETAQN